MLASNALGMDAVGTYSSNSITPSQFTCTLSSTSTATSTLVTAIVLSASLASQITLSGNLNTKINLQASLQNTNTFAAWSLSITAMLSSALSSRSGVSGDLMSSQVIPMFTPSTARTISVQSTTPMFTGGKWWTLTDPKKPRGAKDPDATIDITFDWSPWLEDIGSVQISDVTFTLNGLNSVGTFSDGTKVTVFISGGTAGSAATVSCKIKTLTTPARTDERTVYIDIAEA